MLAVLRVESRTDLVRALSLPNELHLRDPAWVPPLAALVRYRTGRFLEDGSLALFIAERDGRMVGTISTLRDKEFEKARGERVVWWGYFESRDDPEVAAALFERAVHQARAWG